MAAYTALVSLMHTIEQIQHNPRCPLSLDEKHIYSLTENVTFLQNFLEGHSSSGSKEDNDDLESRIADTAYAAEDVIESHIVDQIHAGSTSDHGEKIRSGIDQFYLALQKLTQDMDLIKKEVMVILKEKMAGTHQDRLHRNSSIPTGSVRPASTGQNSTIVSSDDFLNQVMDKLTGQPNNLQIIQIAGMGGIGKTTLARNIYENPLIVQRFDFLAWVTISREYSRRGILQVLYQGKTGGTNDLSQTSEDKLGERVHKKLWGRRYLIVMDDIWSTEAWDKVKSFFPDNNNGSRIMITTRMSNMDFCLSGSHDFHMKLLDEDKSWNLLCEIVFGRARCPVELQNIGKEIAKNCRGLPLSIVAIGGVLTKSEMTRGYWEHTLENLNSLINLENNEHCLQILGTSYKELPLHLKPCFLYMGIFPEDYKIHVSELIKLWVAEGFLKPAEGKSLEVVAENYFTELVDRNLILVHKLGSNGKVRFCKIHDLFRDLCLREAQRQRFLCMLRQQDLNIPEGINIERRICILKDTRDECSHQNIICAMENASLTRSLHFIRGSYEASPSFSFRLLRVYSKFAVLIARESIPGEAIFQQANLRYLYVEADHCPLYRFPPSFSLLWNLEVLTVATPANLHVPNPLKPIIVPSEIWKMPQLKHVMFVTGLELPDPPIQEDIVSENLQTLSRVCNFKCSEEEVKRIPNVKKLKLYYGSLEEKGLPNYCLHNLDRLQELESLALDVFFGFNYSYRDILRRDLVQTLTFPHLLKKLTLWNTNLQWEDLTAKIGSLPLLQVLKLRYNSCIGPNWETVEGQFCSLKFLLIGDCHGLRYWMTDSTHFPILEHLVLQQLPLLEEIPSSIGDIPTLQSIQLKSCSKTAKISAERIKAEQEDLGNEGLKVETSKN